MNIKRGLVRYQMEIRNMLLKTGEEAILVQRK